MPNTREKLIELLDEADEWADHKCDELGCETCPADKMKSNCVQQLMVDRLIANGVTVQKWISVKDERKPKQLQECLCVCQFEDDAKGEWRFYNVLKWHDAPYQDNGIVNRPHFTDEGVHGMVVTHWMPLPQLPQPPKGE